MVEDSQGSHSALSLRLRDANLSIRLLAKVDGDLVPMSGPTTGAVMSPQLEVFGDRHFERLYDIFNG